MDSSVSHVILEVTTHLSPFETHDSTSAMLPATTTPPLPVQSSKALSNSEPLPLVPSQVLELPVVDPANVQVPSAVATGDLAGTIVQGPLNPAKSSLSRWRNSGVLHQLKWTNVQQTYWSIWSRGIGTHSFNLLKSSLRPSSVPTYWHAWKLFPQFLHSTLPEVGPRLPISPPHLAFFIAYMYDHHQLLLPSTPIFQHGAKVKNCMASVIPQKPFLSFKCLRVMESLVLR